jgi:hypothetical protein
MTIRPILFSAPMVRALVTGTKVQTRRILKPQPDYSDAQTKASHCGGTKWQLGALANMGVGDYWTVPWAVGDRLWVREAWRTESGAYDDLKGSDMDADYPVIYEADSDWKLNKSVGRYRHARFMPRWASRLTLTVTDVRLQRLQDISEKDAWAEGLDECDGLFDDQIRQLAHKHKLMCEDGVCTFAALWESINRTGSWALNPWIVALTFTVAKGNVDG